MRTPTHVLNTHHHGDHVGGNLELKAAYPALRIFGPAERVFEYPGPATDRLSREF